MLFEPIGMPRLFALSCLFLLVGCHIETASQTASEQRKTVSQSNDPATPVSALNESQTIADVLTRHTWTHESGSGAFIENWVFRFNPDGSYLYTLVSDSPHTPVNGKWTLTSEEDGTQVLRLSDLERGKYYIIEQTSYPRYDDESNTLKFPSIRDGDAVSFGPWIEFDWEHWRTHYVPTKG